ncbi:MAG: hypothetical protein ACRESZ_12485 [Methylococcales bacterium]
MRKSAEKIIVEVVGQEIHIQQPDPMGNHDDLVIVSPDQVVQLLEWLRDARDKIQNTNA